MKSGGFTKTLTVGTFLAVAVAVLGLALAADAGAKSMAPRDASEGLTPIVLFPAWHFTLLQVDVRNQGTDPECPSSGSFDDVFIDPGPDFSQLCRDELLTLSYRPNGSEADPPPLLRAARRRRQASRTTARQSAPFYEDMYQALEAAGYTRDVNIRVAGYDARLTPDMDGFLGRSMRLIEETYRQNGGRPVHLVGHSNGPIYVSTC